MSGYHDEGQDWTRYVEALRARWWVILMIVAVSVGAAGIYSLTASKRYQAGVDILVAPLNDDVLVGINTLRVGGDPNRSVLTVARLAKTREVAEGVRAQIQTKLTSGELLASVEVQPIGQANIVRIVATRPSAAEAAALANAFADVLIAQRTQQFQREVRDAIERLRRRLAAIPSDVRSRSGDAVAIGENLAEFTSLEGAQDPTLRIASRAVPSDSAIWPKPILSVAIAFIAAILLGTGLAIAAELVDRRLMNEDELIFRYRLPILARIPHMKRPAVRDYLAGRSELPAEAWEGYRTLRANLLSGSPEGGLPPTILVTSAMVGEGKTMSSVNLAIALASGGMNVVLVDGDLRRPMLATVFSLPAPNNGFASLFAKDSTDTASRHLVSVNAFGERLRLLLSNPLDADLVEFLEPRRLRQVFDQLKREADVVIVDSPGATEVADALTLASVVDAVLVAVRLGYTRRDRLNELRGILAQHRIAPLGFIVTTRRRAARYGYYLRAAPQIKQERPPALRRSIRRARA